MPVDPNILKTTDLTSAKVREIEFVNMFQDDLRKLRQCLGVTRMIKKEAGTVLKQYTASGSLESGTVAEGEIIPLSKYTIKPKTYKDLTPKKWRKVTTAESIMNYGYEQAVDKTTDAMLRDVQKGIRTDFVNAVKKGTGESTGPNLQAATAQLWGQLQIKYEDTSIQSVYFANPLDAADYMGSASITTQTAFGLSYIENFLGMGTVIMLSDIPKGQMFATAKSNLVMYYLAVNGADLGEVFDFTSDQLGLIGIHEQPDYDNMTCKDTVVSGIEIFPERADGLCKATISPAA